MKNIVRKIFPITILGIALVIGCLSVADAGRNQCSSLLLDNIEALASDESPLHHFCYGTGSVDCPNGSKVEFVRTNLSLDDYE